MKATRMDQKTNASHYLLNATNLEIARAVREAHAPTLLAVLTHLTGDMSFIRGDTKLDAQLFRDHQGGLTDLQQAQIRDWAFDAIIKFRDNHCNYPRTLLSDEIREIMNWMVGKELSDEYGEFLDEELSLTGEDHLTSVFKSASEVCSGQDFKVVIIGAGMSGLLSGIRLDQAGIEYEILEKNDCVGGTWFENTYPGCRVDVGNYMYSYSFEPYHKWPQYYSTQDVLLDYFKEVAEKYNLFDKITFSTEVDTIEFDDSHNKWSLRVIDKNGERRSLDANAVICAVGQLNRPSIPELPGKDKFKGPSFHSAEWDHSVDLKGKKVAVVGTGASAFQFVPEIAREAQNIVIFQRTPPWVLRRKDYHDFVPEGKIWLMENLPFYAKWYRFWLFWTAAEGFLEAVKYDPNWEGNDAAIGPLNEKIRVMLTEFIKEALGDRQDLIEKSIPNYPFGAKRGLADNGKWYQTLKRDNVCLTTETIAEINESGVRTREGTQHDVDVIVFATGFKSSEFFTPMTIKGRYGRNLHDMWNGDPRAYKGITIPGFPNFFCLYGPNTNIVANGSIIFFSECGIRYIVDCFKMLFEQGFKAIDCKKEVHDRYNRMIDEGNAQMAWGVAKVNSWYKNEKGRVTQNWPFTLIEYWKSTREADPNDYEFLE